MNKIFFAININFISVIIKIFEIYFHYKTINYRIVDCVVLVSM